MRWSHCRTFPWGSISSRIGLVILAAALLQRKSLALLSFHLLLGGVTALTCVARRVGTSSNSLNGAVRLTVTPASTSAKVIAS